MALMVGPESNLVDLNEQSPAQAARTCASATEYEGTDLLGCEDVSPHPDLA